MYLVIGNSIAGVSAIREIRKYDLKTPITVLCKENLNPKRPYYSPLVLPFYIEGTLTRENLFSIGSEFYEQMKVELKLGERAVKLDVKAKKVITENRNEYRFEKLLIATGASPRIPDLKGVKNKGVYVLRIYDDAEKIKKMDADEVVIIGGGPVGVETALALLKLGKRVSIIEMLPNILSTIFSRTLSEMVEGQLRSAGVQVFTGEIPRKISGNPVKSVETDKRKIKCGAVVVAVGVVPNTDFVKDVLKLGQRNGIVVDERMQTSERDIYAAGDCIELKSVIDGSISPFPVWTNAMETGKIAGANMAGVETFYEGGIRINALTVFDRVYFSIGYVQDESKRVAISKNGLIEFYYVDSGRIIGAEIIGDTKYAGLVKRAIKSGRKIDVKKFAGLRDLIMELVPEPVGKITLG